MKRSAYCFLAVLVMLSAWTGGAAKENVAKWKLGVQTYTFHKFTLMETLEKTQQLGLHYAEAFFSQKMGKGFPDDSYLNLDLSHENRDLLKKELARHDITLYACGVASYDEISDWRRFFEFAADMGLKMVTAEPALDDLDAVEKLAREFNIGVAIHNHPKPSVYANPDVLAKALEGRSDYMGVCADIGHWKRSGANPLGSIKRFEGRLKVIHLKDLNGNMEDAQWGTGVLPVKEVIGELARQNFDGLISVEYENFSGSQMDDIAKSLTWFNSVLTTEKAFALMSELDKNPPVNTLTKNEKKNGWTLLFDGKNTTGWHGYNMKIFPDCWAIDDGAFTMNSKGGGEDQDIITDRTYKAFAFSLDYKLTKGANSGILFQVSENPKYKFPYETGPEFQVIDHENWPDKLEDWQINGANYAMYPPMARPYKPVGEWNRLLLVVDGSRVTQILNGQVVVTYEKNSDEWVKLRNSGKWLNFPDWGKFDEGNISLQNHGTKVWYRNIKIKELNPTN